MRYEVLCFSYKRISENEDDQNGQTMPNEDSPPFAEILRGYSAWQAVLKVAGTPASVRARGNPVKSVANNLFVHRDCKCSSL